MAAPIGPAQVLVPGMRGEQLGTTLFKDLGTLLSLAAPSWNGLIRTDPLPINHMLGMVGHDWVWSFDHLSAEMASLSTLKLNWSWSADDCNRAS